MLNRTIAPPITLANKPLLLQPQRILLSNNIPLYVTNSGSQPLTRIEIVYNAGSICQHKKTLANTVANLLREGTAKRTAHDIANMLDFYGAFLETECNRDTATIALFCLNKHLANVLPLVNEIINEATFPSKELSIYQNTQQQRLAVNSTKTDVVCRNLFSANLYGNTHAYGMYVGEANDYTNVNHADVVAFYTKYYKQAAPLRVTIAGLVTDAELTLVQEQLQFGTNVITNPVLQFNNTPQITVNKNMPNAIQSAVRVGKLMFNKTHEDYLQLSITTMILGGYFGSRLMKNIREEKGYTYGISASLASMQQHGFMVIGTEVGTDVTENTLTEINVEINRMQNDLVAQHELESVRNFMLGTFLRSADGAFAQADKFNSLVDWNLNYSYYDRYFETLHTITPEQIRACAQLYYQDMSTVVCGNV
jgi:zinc protease